MSKMIVERAVVEQALEQALEALEDLRVWYHKQMTAVFALRAQLAEPQEPDNGGKTGWPPGLLQDDCRGLSKWLASRPDARQRLREALAEPVQQPFDFLAHLRRQAEFSARTFGPGARVEGVTDHIAKELQEVRDSGGALAEWVDVIILGLDGAWRSGASPEQIVEALVAKQTKNEGRKWPDWRTAPAGKAIEHDRSQEQALPAQPAQPAHEPYIGDVTRIMREAGMTFHLGLPHKAVVEQMTRVVDLVYAEASIKAAQQFASAPPQPAQPVQEPQRKPLSEEEIWKLYDSLPYDPATTSTVPLARAVERAHKIGGEP